MLHESFQVHGMHCASCAANISKKIKALDGVESCEVNFATEKATISYNPSNVSLKTMNEEIGTLGYSLMSTADHGEHTGTGQPVELKLRELATMKEKIEFSLPITLLVFVLMMWDIGARLFSFIPNLPIPMDLFNTVSFLLAAVMLFWIGKQFVNGVLQFLIYRVATMDTLIGIGTLAAFIYSSVIFLIPSIRTLLGVSAYTYFDVTIVVIGFVVLGKYLEARSKQKTGAAIEKLLNLQAKTALILRDNIEREVPLADVVRGDVVIIKPGAKIPVDGVVLEGTSYVDESMVTGEPMPIGRTVGDAVIAGTLNTTGTFTFTATKVGSETLLARIISLVAEAQGSKAPIQALADKISAVFVPIVIVLSFVTLGVWLVVGTPVFGFSQALSYGLVSFVSILVIACPCALGLATPTAIIVGVGKGAREGILIKDAAALETLHKTTMVVVDKTGTLTKGTPEVVSIIPMHTTPEKEVITLLASLEARSEHPLAHALQTYAKGHTLTTKKVTDFTAIRGKGVTGTIDTTTYHAGSAAFMAELGIATTQASIEKYTKQGKTPILIATKTTLIGVVVVADAIKPEAAAAVANLHALGIKVLMLTGDDAHTARSIADQVGIDEVVAQVLPEDKLVKIRELQAAGEIVAMAGDGVNDAPALAQADSSIAMSTGTDVAIETASITLLHGDISKLVKAIRLSKLTMRGIRQNLFWAFIYNIIGIPLAAGAFYPLFGWLLNPVFAGLAMALSSVSVISNSLRLQTKKL